MPTETLLEPETSVGSPARGADLWVDEAMFEEDLRAVLRMMRPHGRERLMGWAEHRTGGAHFRVTVSWDEDFARAARTRVLAVPNLGDVIESLLVGTARPAAALTRPEEFAHYRAVLHDVLRRVDAAEAASA